MSTLTERFPLLENFTLSSILDSIARLAPRQRNLVFTAAAILIGCTLFFSVTAAIKKQKALDTQIETSKGALEQVRELSKDLASQQAQSAQMRSRVREASGFYLASHIEKKAAMAGVPIDTMGTESRSALNDNIEEISADVKFTQISFTRALELIVGLEEDPEVLLRLRRIRMKASAVDPSNIELSFRVSAYVKKSS